MNLNKGRQLIDLGTAMQKLIGFGLIQILSFRSVFSVGVFKQFLWISLNKKKGAIDMPKKESLQHRLERVRPPRVNITYDVEVGGALENKELPFVLGVLGDFAGKPEDPLPALKNRKFVEIDPDNFNQVLAGMKPRVAFTTDNKLLNDDSKLGVDLRFNSIDDFEPDSIVQQVEPLRKLVEARQKLSDLRSKMDGNEKLESMLEDIISSADKQKELSESLGLNKKEE